MMNRRSACLALITVVKTALLTAFVWAAEATAATVSNIAGPHWSVNGDWNPTADEVRRHLLAVHGIDPGGSGLEEMLRLHDSAHNRMGGGGHSHPKKSSGVTKGYRKY